VGARRRLALVAAVLYLPTALLVDEPPIGRPARMRARHDPLNGAV
jgi:ABC-type uncharacterized transport system ATPase subunit